MVFGSDEAGKQTLLRALHGTPGWAAKQKTTAGNRQKYARESLYEPKVATIGGAKLCLKDLCDGRASLFTWRHALEQSQAAILLVEGSTRDRMAQAKWELHTTVGLGRKPLLVLFNTEHAATSTRAHHVAQEFEIHKAGVVASHVVEFKSGSIGAEEEVRRALAWLVTVVADTVQQGAGGQRRAGTSRIREDSKSLAPPIHLDKIPPLVKSRENAQGGMPGNNNTRARERGGMKMTWVREEGPALAIETSRLSEPEQRERGPNLRYGVVSVDSPSSMSSGRQSQRSPTSPTGSIRDSPSHQTARGSYGRSTQHAFNSDNRRDLNGVSRKANGSLLEEKYSDRSWRPERSQAAYRETDQHHPQHAEQKSQASLTPQEQLQPESQQEPQQHQEHQQRPEHRQRQKHHQSQETPNDHQNYLQQQQLVRSGQEQKQQPQESPNSSNPAALTTESRRVRQQYDDKLLAAFEEEQSLRLRKLKAETEIAEAALQQQRDREAAVRVAAWLYAAGAVPVQPSRAAHSHNNTRTSDQMPQLEDQELRSVGSANVSIGAHGRASLYDVDDLKSPFDAGASDHLQPRAELPAQNDDAGDAGSQDRATVGRGNDGIEPFPVLEDPKDVLHLSRLRQWAQNRAAERIQRLVRRAQYIGLVRSAIREQIEHVLDTPGGQEALAVRAQARWCFHEGAVVRVNVPRLSADDKLGATGHTPPNLSVKLFVGSSWQKLFPDTLVR